MKLRWMAHAAAILFPPRAASALGLLSEAGGGGQLSRRDIVGHGFGGAAAAVFGCPLAPMTLAAVGKPLITVIGASGRTGRLCVAACLRRGVAVRALTRGGDLPDGIDPSSEGLTLGRVDVRDPESIHAAVVGSTGVVYAASASKKGGGNAKAIDNEGVVAAARACLAAQIPRFALISSTATTRPDSNGFKYTNILGGIMMEKSKSEVEVKRLFAADASASDYVIVRPGGDKYQ